MDRAFDDDGGYVGYVPDTNDAGQVFLFISIVVFLLSLVALPLAVTLGEKRDELRQLARSAAAASNNSETDEDNEQVQQNSGEQQDSATADFNDDNASVLSKRSYISEVFTGVIRDMRDIIEQQPGRTTKTRGFHRRHRRRHRDVPTKSTGGDEVPVDMVVSTPPGTLATTNEPSLVGDDEAIRMSIEGSVLDDTDKNNSAVACMVDDVVIDRTVCYTMDGVLDEIAAIMAFDYEMKRIIKLSLPFATQAIFTGVLEIMTVAVIGKLVGTRAVSAFVVVNMLVQLTTQFVGGFHEALTTLCSQAIGAKKHRLAGKYVQISTILYVVTYIPFALLWVVVMDDAMRWFGFDEKTIHMGTQYGYLLLFDYLIDGVAEAIHALLDVSGYQNYSTAIGAAEETVAFLIVLVWGLLGAPSIFVSPLFTVGVIEFGTGILFLSLNCFIIGRNGWFRPFREGMVGTFALSDTKAVWLVCKTAMSLSFGYLLTDGEWEVLTIFAGFLGPAEVAAWGIFGTIWDAVALLVDGIADASEVRVAFLLGSDQPEKARLSAYKSMMIGAFTSLFLTSMIYVAGEDLPTWLTNDPTLQHLLTDLIPMFGLGNASMTVGTMFWTLLGAQGRYRLATVVMGIISWTITLPFAAICSIWLNVGLEGQTAAVVIGYLVSGGINAYFIFRSDWVALSNSIMDDNDSRASDDNDVTMPPTPPRTPMSQTTNVEERSGVRVERISSTGISGHWAEPTSGSCESGVEICNW